MLITYLSFTCKDFQSVNTKYFEKPLILVITVLKSHIEVQATVNNIKTLGTSNASTVYSVTLLFPGPLMKCSFSRNHRLVLGLKCMYNYKVRS